MSFNFSPANTVQSLRRKRTQKWRIGKVSAILVSLVLIIFHWWAYTVYPFTVTSAFFFLTMCVAIALSFAAARGADYAEHLLPANGKIIALVPVYNEDPIILREVIEAMLNNTRPPDHIYIIDDGSATPVTPYIHPNITHIRQDNAGKRMAQYSVLKNLNSDDFDFILTVDSDSVIAPDAIEASLRGFSDPKVQAVTSLVMCRNPRSLIGRLIDLEMVVGIFALRRARANFGAVTPTSGALSMYRSSPIMDNLEDYINSGTFSDDRRMAHYALMRGKVIMLNRAAVASDMPETYIGAWRQRVRWYKGYWKYLNWEIINLDGIALGLRIYNTILAVVFPLLMFWIVIWLPATGRPFFWQVFVLWLALLYSQSILYLKRPGKSMFYKFSTWLFLTPLLIPFQLLLVRPAMYWAYFTMRSDKWDGHRVVGKS